MKSALGPYWKQLKNYQRRTLAVALITAAILGSLVVIGRFVAPPGLYPNYLQGSAYFAADGELISFRLAEDQRYRLKLELNNIAPALIQATLLYEDRQFYSHHGVDISAIGRAFWQGVVKGGRRQGASTLTMQLARLRFNLDTTSVSGKLKQMGYAFWLEQHYTKDELLEAYFNYAPYGGNIEGVAAASLIYFHKEASRLSLPESLALAVIPQNPKHRSPLTASGRGVLEHARQRISHIWQEHYKTSNTALLNLPLKYHQRNQIPFIAPHFVNQLQQQGMNNGRFYTSLQHKLQRQMTERLQHYLERHRTQGFHNASMLLIKRSTLQIQAYIGSADFFDTNISGQVDGVSAFRSPGSALKPFVYALAMQQGLIHPQSLLTDLPRRYGSFNPENFDRQFVGPISATEALIKSRNVPAVQLQAQLAQPGFYQWLKQAGVNLPFDAEHYGLALVLGGMEISMQQLVQLYAMLGNGGKWQTLNWQQHGPTMDKLQNEATALLSPEAAFLTLDMLRQHPKPQSTLLNLLLDNAPVAWKTGTSYAFRDAWAIALSGDYVMAVWLGNFDGSSNPNLIGRTAAGPLLFELLALLPVIEQDNTSLFTPGAALNITQVELCSRSGQLPNKYCPQTRPGWFIPGVSPIMLSEVHRAVPVDTRTGLRACQHQPPETELKVYEFWPSDITEAYKQAGIMLQQPPMYQPGCLSQREQISQSPQIRSPQSQLIYRLGKTAEQRQIALQASLDGAATVAHWFVDNRYLGAVKSGDTLFWQAQSGRFQLRVVDDIGGVANQLLEVVE